MSSTTKGKKESRALAATEKANVCTSVRNRYLIVENTRLERVLAGGLEKPSAIEGGSDEGALEAGSDKFP